MRKGWERLKQNRRRLLFSFAFFGCGLIVGNWW